MTVSARASFDVSQYITMPKLPEPAQQLLYFTSSRHRTAGLGEPIVGLPYYEGYSPNCLPVYVGANFFVRLPRGIAYSEFPIKADPFYLEKDPEFGNHPVSGTVSFSSDQIVKAMAQQPYFVYDESGYTGLLEVHEIVERRYTAGQVYRKVGMGKPIYARFQGQMRFLQVSLDALERGSAGWHRFHYSYKINFRAIGLKALDHIIARYSMPDFQNAGFDLPPRDLRYATNVQDGYRRSQISGLDEPWALQILFMFRTLKLEEQIFLSGMNLRAGYWSSHFSSNALGVCIENGNWAGSGKYAARFPILKDVHRTIDVAVAFGLLSHPQSGKVSLTEAGHAFLDIMHKDNDDPDAILRFMDPTTMTIPASEIDRVDAWMMRFFRKMKTKVNAL